MSLLVEDEKALLALRASAVPGTIICQAAHEVLRRVIYSPC